MAEFIKAFGISMLHEGGFANDPDDKGGMTYKGIARKFHPKWEGWKIIDLVLQKKLQNINLALKNDQKLQELVSKFYLDNFWNPLCLEQMPQAIANELFDTGINMGTNKAGEYLQDALNLLNKWNPYLKVDGKIGSATINALKVYYSRRPDYIEERDHTITLLKVLNGLQFMRYYEIVKRDSNQLKFFYGWLNRISY